MASSTWGSSWDSLHPALSPEGKIWNANRMPGGGGPSEEG